MYLYPPLWFVGFCEVLNGSSDPLFRTHFITAILVSLLLLFLYLIGLPLHYRKYKQNFNLALSLKKNRKWALKFQNLFNSVFLKNQIQKGLFYFYIKTLKRNQRSIIRLAIIMGFPLGIVIAEFVYFYIQKGSSYFQQNELILFHPTLILLFFLIIGIKMVGRVAVLPEINWIFKLSDVSFKNLYLRSYKQAVWVIYIFPLIFLISISYLFMINIETAFNLFIYLNIIAFLLLEIIFFNYKKIPFVSVILPGNTKTKFLIPIYAFLFFLYLDLFSRLGSLCFKPENKIYLLLFCISIIGFISISKFIQKKKSQKEEIIFEEEFDPLVLSLDLDQKLF
jgi:hypothetical protein